MCCHISNDAPKTPTGRALSRDYIGIPFIYRYNGILINILPDQPVYCKKKALNNSIPRKNPDTVYTGINGMKYSHTVGNTSL